MRERNPREFGFTLDDRVERWIEERDAADKDIEAQKPPRIKDFHVDRVRSRLVIVPHFDDGFQVNAGSVAASRSALGILDLYRRAKRRQYRRMLADPKYSGLRILAEGDSWFEFPLGPTSKTGDLVRSLWTEYAILSLAKAGDSWEEIAKQDELFPTIVQQLPDIVMLSVGGNSILGEVPLYVRQYKYKEPKEYYPIENLIDNAIDVVIANHESVIDRLVDLGIPTIIHGYDYGDPRPRNEGGYLVGGPLEESRGIFDRTVWRYIMKFMLDKFNDRLKALAAMPKYTGLVYFVPLLGIVGTNPDDWYDEVHPDPGSFYKLSREFVPVIDAIAKSLSDGSRSAAA